MPANNINVGPDYQFLYYDGATGALIDLGDVQTVRITSQKHDLKSMPYDDVPRFAYVPDGFRIEFTLVRNVPTWENFQVAYDQAFNNGNIILPGVLNESINNPDGSVSRYQYQGCAMHLNDHGDISRERPAMLRLEGLASEKVQIS
jgi:hypothetical protein